MLWQHQRNLDLTNSDVCVFKTELQENTEALKTKMSELRLYCDLLLQQVNKIKESDEPGETAEVRSGRADGTAVKSGTNAVG